MSAQFPDTATLRAALALAARAPSVHNIQPWQWHVGADTLHLHTDPTRRLIHTDPDGRDMMLSCGAALHHCIVAFAALGWQSRVRRFPDPDDDLCLASIQLRPQPAAELDITLAAAIPRRRTDRRHFSDWPVGHGDISLMGVRAARMGVVMRRVDAALDLRAALARAVWQHATDPDYLDELTVWTGRYASNAGVPARNTPESDAASPVPARIFAGAALAQPPEVSAGDDRGAVLALGTARDDGLARLRAGEATSLLLLTATAQGLASCPVTEPLEIPETRACVRADAFDDGCHPQMLLRVGWAPVNADPLDAPPRRALEDQVFHMDGTPLF